MRTATVVGGWLLTSAVLLILGLAMLFYAAPKLMGWQGVIVLTGSMEPALKTGGVAFVDPIDQNTRLTVGDIITFQNARFGDNRISHRIIEIVPSATGEMYRTKGDANEVADAALVPRSDVRAKVRYHIPYIGYFAERMRDRLWFYMFLGVPAAFIVLNEVGNIRRELRNAGAPAPPLTPESAPAETELLEPAVRAATMDLDALWASDIGKGRPTAAAARSGARRAFPRQAALVLLLPGLLVTRWAFRKIGHR